MKAILTYHSIDDSGSPISVGTEAFERHVAFLASGAVEVVGLDAIERTQGPAVAITFDDGFGNFADFAWPRLRDAGLPATVFVVTGPRGRRQPLGRRGRGGHPRPAAHGLGHGRRRRRPGRDDRVPHPHPRPPSAARGRRPRGRGAGLAGRTGRAAGRRAPRVLLPPTAIWTSVPSRRRAKGYDQACTTELAALQDGADTHRLARLDAYYLQGPGRLETFGSGGFRRYVTGRRFLRGVRSSAVRWLPGGGA